MKIIHVMYQVNHGGIESFVMNIARNFHNDAEFVFLTYKQEKFDYEDEIKKLGGRILRINPPKKGKRIKHINELIAVFKNEKPDVVHCHTYYDSANVMYAAKRAGVRNRIAHSHTTEKFGIVRSVIHWFLRRVINNNATTKIACSEEAGKSLFGKNAGFKVIPNGIDIEKFKFNRLIRDEVRKELGINSDDIVIGHIGRLSDVKNHDLMIEIVKSLKGKNFKYKMVFIGDGEEFNRIEYNIRRNKLDKNVILLGNKENTGRYLNAFDVFLLPSKYEGLAIALVEAEFNGLSAVISDTVPEEAIIKANIEKISLSCTPEEWANCIISINKDRVAPGKAETYKYSLENLMKNMGEIYGINKKMIKNDNKIVSVIVPAYNASAYINRCIESIQTQTYNEIEIVVVDDGSTDDTIKKIEKYAADDSRIRVLKQKNSGPSAARLNGVMHATGDYVMFVDADDYINVKTVERVISVFAEDDIDSVRFCGITYPGKQIFGKIAGGNIVLDYNHKMNLLLKTDLLSSMWLQAFKRTSFEGISVPREKILYCEDYLMSFLLHKNIERTAVIDDELYVYCDNKKSTTRTNNIARLMKNVEDRLKVSRKMIESIEESDSKADIDYDYIVAYQFDRVRRDLSKLLHRTQITKYEFAEFSNHIFMSDDFLFLCKRTNNDKMKSYIKKTNILSRIKNGRIIMDIYHKNYLDIWKKSRFYRI